MVLARDLAAAETGTIPAALAAFDRRAAAPGRQAGQDGGQQPRREDRGPDRRPDAGVIMPHVFNRFYEKATGWLYDFDPGALPVTPRR